jgi:arsenite methyltransferase
VFKEAFRVLKPNGRLMVSDIVLLKKLPEAVRKNVQAYVGCISGAEMRNKYLQMIEEAGFQQVNVKEENLAHAEDIADNSTAQAIMRTEKIRSEEIEEIANSVASVKVSAVKPK